MTGQEWGMDCGQRQPKILVMLGMMLVRWREKMGKKHSTTTCMNVLRP